MHFTQRGVRFRSKECAQGKAMSQGHTHSPEICCPALFPHQLINPWGPDLVGTGMEESEGYKSFYIKMNLRGQVSTLSLSCRSISVLWSYRKVQSLKSLMTNSTPSSYSYSVPSTFLSMQPESAQRSSDGILKQQQPTAHHRGTLVPAALG